MLSFGAMLSFIIVIAVLFGFGGIAVGATAIAKIMFFAFLALFVITLFGGLVKRGSRQGRR